MKRFGWFLLIVVSLTAGCKKAEKPVDAEKDRPSDAELAKLEHLGEAIYLKDWAAAKSTDILLEKIGQPEPGDVNGWVIINEGNGYLTRFIRQTPQELKVIYDVRIDAIGKGEFWQGNLRPLSDTEKAMFRARQNAARAAPMECADSYNTVVLEDPDSDGWLVYVLAATTDKKTVVVGGHSRVRVSPDGTEVISVIPLYKSCLVAEKPSLEQAEEPTAFYVSFPIADVPSEIHVYLNRLYGYDLYVVTASEKWLVIDGKITPIVQEPRDDIQ